jgi:hypothetical protein
MRRMLSGPAVPHLQPFTCTMPCAYITSHDCRGRPLQLDNCAQAAVGPCLHLLPSHLGTLVHEVQGPLVIGLLKAMRVTEPAGSRAYWEVQCERCCNSHFSSSLLALRAHAVQVLAQHCTVWRLYLTAAAACCCWTGNMKAACTAVLALHEVCCCEPCTASRVCSLGEAFAINPDHNVGGGQQYPVSCLCSDRSSSNSSINTTAAEEDVGSQQLHLQLQC